MSEFKSAAKTSELGEGQMKVVNVGGQSVALCRVAGQFYAVGNLCSHANATFDEGPLSGSEIECPRHGARFDVKTGQPLSLPATKAIQTFPVRVNGEDIEVGVDHV